MCKVSLDNNATERALQSFCLYKHTQKFIDTMEGANASAIIYSITETAKANRFNLTCCAITINGSYVYKKWNGNI